MNNKKRGRPPNDYLIDFCERGNGIRLYFGSSVEVITGDDWSDIPYDCNADIVYSEYVNFYIDVLVPFNWRIADPATELDQYTNSPYCRNDFKTGDPALFWTVDQNYERDNVYFRMGDLRQDVMKKLEEIGAITKVHVKRKQ